RRTGWSRRTELRRLTMATRCSWQSRFAGSRTSTASSSCICRAARVTRGHTSTSITLSWRDLRCVLTTAAGPPPRS
ncbi:hypothetical protein GGI22_007193, partial [Coemansia erecta]